MLRPKHVQHACLLKLNAIIVRTRFLTLTNKTQTMTSITAARATTGMSWETTNRRGR